MLSMVGETASKSERLGDFLFEVHSFSVLEDSHSLKGGVMICCLGELVGLLGRLASCSTYNTQVRSTEERMNGDSIILNFV